MRHQRVTIFEDDDATPWREFSTDPAAALPYLIAPDEGPELEVDVLKGEASLGLASIQVGDVALVAGDQDGGAFTDSLAISGDTAYVGRRAHWEIEDGLGGWKTRLDGVAGAPALNPDEASYTLPLRNTLERARKTGAFDSAAERDGSGDIVQAPTVLPQGAFAGYAQSPVAGSPWPWLLSPTKDMPRSGTYQASDKTIRWSSSPTPTRAFQSQFDAARAIPVFDDLGAFVRYASRDVVVLWRPAAGGAWREVRDVIVPADDSTIFITGTARVGTEDWTTIRAVRLDGTSADPLPSDGAAVEFVVAYIGTPNEYWPRYLEGSLASLWRAAYDGDWSEFPPRVKYDAARMTTLEAETPVVHMRVTEPTKDLREWMQKNLFKPFGWAPALNEAGEVSPISHVLPDPSVSLVTLDGTNTEEAEWMHDDGNAVNVIEFESIVESRALLYGEGDLVTETKKLEVFQEPLSLALLGEQKESFEQISLRATDYAGGAFGPVLGGQFWMMLERKTAIFDRYAWGPQRVRAVVAASVGLTLGTWATCGWSWLPDYQTNRRGMSRLMQVRRLKPLDENFVEVVLEDAGAANTPLVAPTLGTVTESGGVVSVPVTTIPAGEARVDYAVVPIGDPVPGANSGEWRFGGRTALTGTVTLPTVLEAVDVLVRARAEAQLRRPSAYTAVQRVTAAPAPAVRLLQLTLNIDGSVTATWVVSPVTDALRLHYAAHAGADPTFAEYIDVDPSLGSYTFGAELVTSAFFSVEAEPFAGATPGTRLPASITTIIDASIYGILSWQPAYTDPSGNIVPYAGEIGAAVTNVLLWTLLRQQGGPSPWANDEIEAAGFLTAPNTSGRDISYPFDVPAEGWLKYFRLRPMSIVDGRVVVGPAIDGVVYPKAAQAPVADLRWTDDGVTLTAWLELQDRGIPVTAVRGLTQIANNPIVTTATPTRVPGGASTYAGGTLAAGQYEQDAALDSYRTTRVGFEVTLLTGEVITHWTPAHDRNRMPEFATGVKVDGTVITVEGDDDTISFLVERIDGGGTWSRGIDNWTGSVDVALADGSANPGIGTDELWVLRVTLYSDPLADVDVDTLMAVQEVTVISGSPSVPVLETVTLAEPAIGDDEITITLEADSAPVGHTMQVDYRYQIGGGAWSGQTDITASLTPSLSAPPTSPTAYVFSTGIFRIAKDVSQPIVTIHITARILDGSSAQVAAESRTVNYYTAAS